MPALQQVAQHGTAYALAAEIRGHGHLPDKQRVFAVGLQVGRDKAGQLAVTARDHAGAGEVPAQQQISVSGVVIQRAASAHQGCEFGTVAGLGLAQLDRKIRIYSMNISWGQVSMHWTQ